MAPQMIESPYTVLGISSNCDEAEIKKAYRKLALKWHPDKHTEETSKAEAEKQFKRIAQAYEILSDKKKKAEFDRSQQPSMFRRRSAPGFRMHHSNDMFRSPFDIFREFFGNRDPFENVFFDDSFSFPDADPFAFKKPSRSRSGNGGHRFPSSRVHIFYDDDESKPKAKDNNNSFSTVISFSSATEPGKPALVRKTSMSTKLVDGKKIVTKTVENGNEHIVEVHEDGELKCRTVTTPPSTPTVISAK